MTSYILINILSGDGFLADNTKPLPELVLNDVQTDRYQHFQCNADRTIQPNAYKHIFYFAHILLYEMHMRTLPGRNNNDKAIDDRHRPRVDKTWNTSRVASLMLMLSRINE